MPNTKSAAKALRQNKRKHAHNLFWKRKINATKKAIKNSLNTDEKNIDILRPQESALQKVLDKAVKNNVIHRNKANRIKSRISKEITKHAKSETKPKQSKATSARKSAGDKLTKSTKPTSK